MSDQQWEWAQRRWPDGAILWAGESEEELRASMKIVPFRTLVRRPFNRPDAPWEDVDDNK